MSELAAIDIGSNAMRLVIGTFSPRGKLIRTHTIRESVRLGADVFRDGAISQATMNRTVAALKRFRKEIDSYQVVAVRAVATSAMRDAKNGAQLIKKIQRATGIEIEIISGDEEGFLVYKAVDEALQISRSSALIVDIGGGSVESCLLRQGKVLFAESVKLGSVRLLQLLKRRKNPVEVLQKLVRKYAAHVGAALISKRSRVRLRQFVGTGGNIECYGTLRKRVLGKKRTDFITLSELEKLVTQLSRMSVKERISKFKLRRDRADVILPAGILLLAIMREARIKKLTIPGVGLKEGVLHELAERMGRRVNSFAPSKGKGR